MSIRSTIKHAQRRFVDGRNVLAIGWGKKRVGGGPVEKDALIFYVRRKGSRFCDEGSRIPRWLYDRDVEGRVDRSKRYVTDVRRVGRAELVSSGQRCSSVVDVGTATLAFDAYTGSARAVYVLTCGHVIGDVHQPQPGFKRVKLELPQGGRVKGVRRHHLYGRQGTLDYDVAIAEIEERPSEVPLRVVSRAAQPLTAFLRSAAQPGRSVKALGHATGVVKAGRVAGRIRTPFPLTYRNGVLGVRNLFELEEFTPRSGDSGGIVYSEERAVGLVVARLSAGGCLFHSLYAATKKLLASSGLALDVDQIF